MKIKTGDTVIVISGDEKGKTGKVLKALPKKDMVVVEGINVVTRHSKPSQRDPNGKVRDITHPIHVSNVALIDPKTKKATRVGYSEVDGKKIRISKRSGSTLE